MSTNGKPKFAMYWAAACGGCEIAVLNIDEKILEFRSFPQQVSIVRCKTFRATEKKLNTDVAKLRQPVHGFFQHRFEVVPVFG